MTGDPRTRVQEAGKQSRIAHDQLSDEDDLPEGLVGELGDVSERLGRIRYALEEVGWRCPGW